jgi:hypothetical protein
MDKASEFYVWVFFEHLDGLCPSPLPLELDDEVLPIGSEAPQPSVQTEADAQVVSIKLARSPTRTARPKKVAATRPDDFMAPPGNSRYPSRLF